LLIKKISTIFKTTFMNTRFAAAAREEIAAPPAPQPDIFRRIRKYMGPLGQYASVAEGYYIFPELEGALGNRMLFKGKEVICWSINNYLGLASHPEVVKADAEATAQWGLAYPMGARLMTGETNFHKQLEQKLAALINRPACCLLNYGYQGMVSCIDALVSRHDVIIYDAECHACILDGIRLHQGSRFSFEHNDVRALEKQLSKAVRIAENCNGGILVISEGVFGMRGDQGRLREIAGLKQKYPFRFLVDDAHGLGTLGPGGSGTANGQNVQNEIDIYFGTFAKAMASVGAFVAGERDIIRYLKYNMRSQVFAKSLPLPVVLGVLKRLEIIRQHPEFISTLWKNVEALQQGLRDAGFDIGMTNSPVTPVYLNGSPEEAAQLVYDLRENHGIFCSLALYPVIPKGEILLRLIPTSMHTKEDIEETLVAFREVAVKLRSGSYGQKVLNPVL
jgi:glycine C-acetyltransferase